MNKITFSCTVNNSSPFDDLALEFWLNEKKFFDNNIDKGVTDIAFDFEEGIQEHSLKICLKNKQAKHTTIDKDGNIESDALISVSKICFNDVDISKIVSEKANYNHDFNGSGQPTCEKFYGDLGCNGTVELVFNTPLYIWLLENM